MSRRARPTRGLALLALTVVTGCAVGPNYHRPKIEVPTDYRFARQTRSAASIADLPWWDVFHDDALRALLLRALESNFDLRIAVARVEQSRALARAAGAKLLPSVGLMGAAAYGNGSASPSSVSLYSGSVMASWEPDVFGSLRRSAEEAQANYAASEEARRNVWLTVLADVAQAYFQLLAFDVQRQITLRTIGAREETLELYRTQLKGGVATGLEVARAEADLYSAQATLSSVELQIATSENAISLLLGLAPGPVARSTPSSETLAPPPEVPAGLPSSLLARRPDVRQAEAQLVSANAEVGVQTAKLFPTFPLTAAPSLMSLAFSGLSIKGFSYLLLGTANWTAPILQGSALLAQVSAANAAKKAALVAYEQAMFTALREVNDALVSLDRLRDERTLGENQVAQLARAVDISLSEFHGGTATYLDVVTAQETEFSAQLSLAQLEGQQLVEFVQLYRALGGGWWLAERRG